MPLASWARFTEITFPFSAEGERNLSPGEKGEKIEGHYNVITSYPADPDVPEIEYCLLEDMKGRRRAAYRGRREHVNREKRGKYLNLIVVCYSVFMQKYMAQGLVMHKLPVRFIPERIGW